MELYKDVGLDYPIDSFPITSAAREKVRGGNKALDDIEDLSNYKDDIYANLDRDRITVSANNMTDIPFANYPSLRA